MPAARPAVDRFWEKVNKDGPIQPKLGTPCWLWTGCKIAFGHGQFYPKHGQMVLAHRFAWELVNGPIPDGLSLLHHCDNPPCVNPEHNFTGTQLDNMTDMASKGRAQWGVYQRNKTDCKRGHAFTPENTYRWNGERQCRQCRHEQYLRTNGAGRRRRCA